MLSRGKSTASDVFSMKKKINSWANNKKNLTNALNAGNIDTMLYWLLCILFFGGVLIHSFDSDEWDDSV